MHDSLLAGFANRLTKIAEDSGQKWFDDKTLTKHEKSILKRQADAEAKDQVGKKGVDLIKELRNIRREGKTNPNNLLFTEIGSRLGAVAGAGAAIGATSLINKGIDKIEPVLRKLPGGIGQYARPVASFLTFAPIAVGGTVAGANYGHKADEYFHEKKITPEMLAAEKIYNKAHEDVYFDPEFRKRVYESMKIMGQIDDY